MGDKNIEQSQQVSQGFTIGQSNEDMTIPHGTKGPQEKGKQDKENPIPNQEQSSASRQEKSGDKR